MSRWKKKDLVEGEVVALPEKPPAKVADVSVTPTPISTGVLFEAIVYYSDPLTLKGMASNSSTSWPFKCFVDLKNRVVVVQAEPKVFVPFERVARMVPVG
jgi:hypothetical protein